MRPFRQFAVFVGLTAGLLSSAALGARRHCRRAASPAPRPRLLSPAGQRDRRRVAVAPQLPAARSRFAVTCASRRRTSATLFGTTLGLPAQIPMGQGAAGGGCSPSRSRCPAASGPARYTPPSTAATAVRPLPACGSRRWRLTAARRPATARPRPRTNTSLSAVGLGLIASAPSLAASRFVDAAARRNPVLNAADRRPSPSGRRDRLAAADRSIGRRIWATSSASGATTSGFRRFSRPR